MTLPTASPTDYLWQFQRLLPRGRVWHRGWGTLQAQYLLTLMPSWARLHGRANDLVVDIFPCTTSSLLTDWEASLGLPDPCVGPLPTIQQRVAAVCAKFAHRGGQSIPYFEDLAKSLGYDVTITTPYQPFRAGYSAAGDRLYGEGWSFVWVISCPETTIVYFRSGLSRAGEPLATWGNDLLECTIRAQAPAHTIPIFEYGD